VGRHLVALEALQLPIVRAGDSLDGGERQDIARMRGEYEHVVP
jgi:hypothetical protein